MSATTLLQLETDCDAGVPSRLLDLLTVQQPLPEQMTIDWHATGISVRLGYAPGTAPSANLVTRLRMMPGVRSIAEADQP